MITANFSLNPVITLPLRSNPGGRVEINAITAGNVFQIPREQGFDGGSVADVNIRNYVAGIFTDVFAEVANSVFFPGASVDETPPVGLLGVIDGDGGPGKRIEGLFVEDLF